ncbi:class I SAM-dependent methyltransferase [Shimwellia pseudoproteus]|uniref:class I SAM-dependent methyltransferase n=1 Tax=Shimwellia pseudoproteus TaxID=570012 RepID=UPI0018ECEC67|nr:class I SAM-dependent methyltransferase [Shimwellia pseudoproteus]MBJ3816227.1 class I SAM-dependent methyltransferase [Shimwellia pseudoproteus]
MTTTSTTPSHHHHVDSQFGDQACAYLTSQVHAAGRDLERLQHFLAAFPGASVLDIGCGAGHASYVAAAQAGCVIAYDLSAQMLDVVAATARERGLDNLTTRQGVAESLPFEDSSMDVVISRYSAHHWHDVGMALREIRRVLRPGGQCVMMDIMSPGHPASDIWLQTIEALRDTSHVRDYSAGEWAGFFSHAGLAVNQMHCERQTLDFTSWVQRMRTPEALVAAIRLYQDSAPEEVKRYFDLQPDGTFTSDTLWMSGTR